MIIAYTFKFLLQEKTSHLGSLLDVGGKHRWRALPEILTAQVWGSPVQGLSTCMGTLPGVLSKGVAHAEVSHRAVTVAQVLYASFNVVLNIHQHITARKCFAG